MTRITPEGYEQIGFLKETEGQKLWLNRRLDIFLKNLLFSDNRSRITEFFLYCGNLLEPRHYQGYYEYLSLFKHITFNLGPILDI